MYTHIILSLAFDCYYLFLHPCDYVTIFKNITKGRMSSTGDGWSFLFPADVTTQKGFVVDMYLYQCITYHPCYFCDTITHLDWSYDITSPITLDFPIFLD
jgi:hypothetical protein